MCRLLYFSCLFLILLGAWITGVSSRSVKITDLRVRFSHKYFSALNYELVNSSINMDVAVDRTLNYGLMALLDFQLRLKDSVKYQTLFTHSVNVCRMVLSLKDSMLKKWFASLSKFGNFMDSCPVTEGYYFMQNWHWDINLVPAYLYPGDYCVTGHGYYGKYNSTLEDFVVHCDLYFTLLPN